jgi:hypothetical protein
LNASIRMARGTENFTLFRHEPGSIRLCWACDNLVRDQYTETLAGIARENLVSWLITVIRSQLGFNEDHQLTIGVVLVAGYKQSGARHP